MSVLVFHSETDLSGKKERNKGERKEGRKRKKERERGGGMATHSSVLAWRIPGTGQPGGLPSMGSHRVGHD